MEFLNAENTLKSKTFSLSSISEDVATAAKSLRDIAIGDSTFIIDTASLEENEREIINSIHSMINESNEATETAVIDGQGDANIKSLSESSIINESMTGEAFGSPNEVGSKLREEMIEESSCFLQRIIKDMEKQEPEPKVQGVPVKVPNNVVKEEISTWEEKEEELIRVIEVPEVDDTIDYIYDEEEQEEEAANIFIEETIGEMTFIGDGPKLSSSLLSKESSPKGEYVEEILIEELGSFPLSPDVEEQKSLPPPPPKLPLPPIPAGGSEFEAKDNCKAHKSGGSRKWLGDKLRKFFHFYLGRHKH